MTEKKILVLGGTGLLGEPVVRGLHKEGFDVRILVRDIEKARKYFGEEYEIIVGDATVLQDVEKALEGCYGVHMSLSGEAEIIAARHVSSRAKEMGVERISFISGCTVVEENRWFSMIDNKLQVEKIIQDSGVDYMIFAPSWPMEMLERYARGGKPLLIGKQTYVTHFFAVNDLGRMVSLAYQKEEAANHRFIVHGPEGVPFAEALMRYCNVFHPEVNKLSGLPVWLVKLMATLMRNDLMKFGAELAGYFDRVGELGDPNETNKMLGAPSITLDEWFSHKKNLKEE